MSFAVCYSPKAIPFFHSEYNLVCIFTNRSVHTVKQWSRVVVPELKRGHKSSRETVHSLAGYTQCVSVAMMRSAISQADMSMKLDLIHFSFICEPSIISSHQSKVGCIPETMLFLNAIKTCISDYTNITNYIKILSNPCSKI